MGSKGLSLPKTSHQEQLEKLDPHLGGEVSAGISRTKNLSRLIAFSCTVAAILVGAILRFTVACDALWLDELHATWVVDGTLADVVPRAAYGNQAPLYFWLMWPVVKLVGLSELSLRSWSLLAGLCLIGGGSWVTWRFTRSATTAAFVAWIFTLDPTMIFYGTEARPYAAGSDHRAGAAPAVLELLAIRILFPTASLPILWPLDLS